MWWPFIQSLGGNEQMEVVGINVKTSEMDQFLVRFVDVFWCHRLFVSWKVHKTCGLPQLLFLVTKIHRFNHWGCGDEWRNDVILLVSILANSYQKWTRRVGFSLGEKSANSMTQQLIQLQGSQVLSKRNRCFILVASCCFFPRFIFDREASASTRQCERKANGCVVFMGLHGFLYFLTLQRRKQSSSDIMCFIYAITIHDDQ